MPVTPVPPVRVRTLNAAAPRPAGDWVLYWMTAFRRTQSNFALQRALELAETWGKPLLVLEALRCDYPWASVRFHRFVLQGMAANARRFEGGPARYYPYVERERGEGRGLVEALGARACAVVADDYPCFFLPKALAAAASRLPVRMEAVDSNGLYPMADTERVFTTAHSFRAHLQKVLPRHLSAFPDDDPLAAARLPSVMLPKEVTQRWPQADGALLEATAAALAALPIDGAVGAVSLEGGADAAHEALERFVRAALPRYPEERSEPEVEGTSRLSPYLHFGHLSAHQVFRAVAKAEGWSPWKLQGSRGGSREGYWQMSPAAEAFIDQLVTWRELGFNFCAKRDDYDQYESLPDWARATLEEHAQDPRPHVYSLAELDAARTHDPLWNAAQMQLRTEGWFHNSMRMLWGKKVLEWSRTPRQALAAMCELMNKYSLDGRDPNSYSGAGWVLGRYDRAWGPERPVFGKVRFMSSANTARKLSTRGYVARYAPR